MDVKGCGPTDYGMERHQWTWEACKPGDKCLCGSETMGEDSKPVGWHEKALKDSQS